MSNMNSEMTKPDNDAPIVAITTQSDEYHSDPQSGSNQSHSREIITAVLTCWIALSLHMTANLIVASLSNIILSTFWLTETTPDLVLAIMRIVRSILVTAFMIFTFQTSAGFDKFWDFIPSLGLNKFSLSKNFFIVQAIRVAMISIFMGVQVMNGVWFFSTENFYKSNLLTPEEKFFSWERVVTMFITSPIQEEILYRGIFHLMLSRYIQDPWKCILWSNAFFGFSHSMNIFATSFNGVYILVQIILGTLIGTSFSCHFVLGGSLWESILLHFLNNFASSWTSVNQLQDDLHSLWTALPIFQAVVFYLLWVMYLRAKIQEKDIKQKKVLQDKDKMD